MKRITSIDSLRAFALLGILIIHTTFGFGAGGIDYTKTFDYALKFGIMLLFRNRCMLIFNILFGVSFYIILNKKDYPASKFVWRCFLLMMLGLLNRIFFNNDVLFKYGLCGMLLVLIRNMSNKCIYVIIGVLIMLGMFLKEIELGKVIDCPSRYIENISFWQFLQSYPSSLFVLIKQFLNGDFFIIYANMAIGYVMGRLGFVESMDTIIKTKHVILFLGVYFVIGMIYVSQYFGVTFNPFVYVLLMNLFWYCGAAFYWILFIWLYNNSKCFNKIFTLFEPYGKLGLTNYTMQGLVGVAVFYFCGIAYKGISFSIILVCVIGFFLMQTIFSIIWLKYFKNGPLEYLWRCATERKWLPLTIYNVPKT